jgi:hypothetical protein
MSSHIKTLIGKYNNIFHNLLVSYMLVLNYWKYELICYHIIYCCANYIEYIFTNLHDKYEKYELKSSSNIMGFIDSDRARRIILIF